MNLFFSKIKEIKPSQWFFVGIVAMITIAHVLIYSFMPYTCDDYWYMTPFRDYFMGSDSSFPAESLWHCWSDHYQTDNIRLANIVFSFFLLLLSFSYNNADSISTHQRHCNNCYIAFRNLSIYRLHFGSFCVASIKSNSRKILQDPLLRPF